MAGTSMDEVEVEMIGHNHRKSMDVFMMDDKNMFQPLVSEIDAVKIAKQDQDYWHTKAQENAMRSDDTNMATRDILISKFVRYCFYESIMTDVIIYVGRKAFHAHRIMLAKYSPYLMELFKAEEHSRLLPHKMMIMGVSVDAFKVFMDFIYSGDCKIMTAIVYDLSLIATKFCVEELQIKIKECLLNASDDCLGMLQGGNVSCEDPIYEYIIMSVSSDFRKISKSSRFVELPLDIVCELLSSDVLNVKETDVYDAAMTWIQHDFRQRESHLLRVMGCVRFALMDCCDLHLILRHTMHILERSESCRAMLLEANW
jgi:hypothetical protein